MHKSIKCFNHIFSLKNHWFILDVHIQREKSRFQMSKKRVSDEVNQYIFNFAIIQTGCIKKLYNSIISHMLIRRDCTLDVKRLYGALMNTRLG